MLSNDSTLTSIHLLPDIRCIIGDMELCSGVEVIICSLYWRRHSLVLTSGNIMRWSGKIGKNDDKQLKSIWAYAIINHGNYHSFDKQSWML